VPAVTVLGIQVVERLILQHLSVYFLLSQQIKMQSLSLPAAVVVDPDLIQQDGLGWRMQVVLAEEQLAEMEQEVLIQVQVEHKVHPEHHLVAKQMLPLLVKVQMLLQQRTTTFKVVEVVEVGMAVDRAETDRAPELVAQAM
jgi:hypothetical protein